MRRYLAAWYRRNRCRYPVPRGNSLVDAGVLAYHCSAYYLVGRVWFWARRPRSFLLAVRFRLGFPPAYRIGV